MRSIKIYLCSAIIFVFSACEVAGGGEKRESASKSVLLAFFTNLQGSEQDLIYRDYSSYLSGSVYGAETDSSFQNWVTPRPGCIAATSDAVDVSLSRRIDAGKLTIEKNGSEELALPISDQLSYFAFKTFDPGNYQLLLDGINQKAKLDLPFRVLEDAENLTLTHINHPDSSFSAPQTIDSGISESLEDAILIVKSVSIRIAYEAPPETDYVKVTLSDYPENSAPSDTSGGLRSIVCYSDATDTSIDIPVNLLNRLQDTDYARLNVDFISTSFVEDAFSTKESLMINIKRHAQGAEALVDEKGVQQFMFLGQLFLRDLSSERQ